MSETRFASSLSTAADSAAAVQEAAAALATGLGGTTPDLLVAFASHHHGPALESLGARLMAATGGRHLVGCTGEAIVGSAQEVEDRPALSIWAAVLPGTAIAPFHVRAGQEQDGGIVYSELPDVADRSRASLLLLGDPFTFPMADFLRRIDDELPGVPAVGGMSSGGHGPGQNLLFLDEAVVAEGAIGAVIEGAVEVRSVVSQGCRPIGEPWVITACEGPLVEKLGARPAAEVLIETLRSAPEAERELFQRGSFIGLAVDANKSDFDRGDFLVRGIRGLDGKRGAIFVTDDSVRRGMTVQFLVRDAESAGEDLTHLMRQRTSGDADRDPSSIGALVFSCNGRGSRMFDQPDHDIRCVQSAFASQVPAAGFFAMGEIGPVGGRNFLHGFTASVAVFRERD